MKIITFAIPCYNSADYMDKCLSSLLLDDILDDIEVIIVNDGSSDNTSARAHEWEEKYPSVVRVIDKENGGHGSAVNAGLDHAEGLYYKVVDSDDWLDEASLRKVLLYLHSQIEKDNLIDLLITNYVYEKVYENKRNVVDYKNVFPLGYEFGWDETHRFRSNQYLLMHSVIYKTELLKKIHLQLPEHCFYVDNIFVYVPLPHVKTIRYLPVDLYRYFIGREGQSVNEETMLKRIDQQIRVTKIMIDAVDLSQDVPSKKLKRYMESYLSMMLCICSVFLRMKKKDENEEKRQDIWAYLKEKRPRNYAKIRGNVLNLGVNLPSDVGRIISLSGYHLAQKLFKFN